MRLRQRGALAEIWACCSSFLLVCRHAVSRPAAGIVAARATGADEQAGALRRGAEDNKNRPADFRALHLLKLEIGENERPAPERHQPLRAPRGQEPAQAFAALPPLRNPRREPLQAVATMSSARPPHPGVAKDECFGNDCASGRGRRKPIRRRCPHDKRYPPESSRCFGLLLLLPLPCAMQSIL